GRSEPVQNRIQKCFGQHWVQAGSGDWVEDPATEVLQDVLDQEEVAMDYWDRNASCTLRHFNGSARVETIVEKATKDGQFADSLTSAGLNVASIFAGPYASAVGAAKDLYNAVSVATDKEDGRAAEAFMEPSYSVLNPGELGEDFEGKDKQDRIDQDAGSFRIVRGGNDHPWSEGNLQIQAENLFVVTGQTLLVYVDIGARAQATAEGYGDWDLWNKSDAPDCHALSRLRESEKVHQNCIKIFNRGESSDKN
ncbi:MAG: hypothetical protein ACLFWL_19220, partial [Candidatus Brocadiia bacterium]